MTIRETGGSFAWLAQGASVIAEEKERYQRSTDPHRAEWPSAAPESTRPDFENPSNEPTRGLTSRPTPRSSSRVRVRYRAVRSRTVREPPSVAARCPRDMADERDEKRLKDDRFETEALRWLPDVTRFALSLTRSEPDADDLVQETFLRAYRSWSGYSSGSECRGWLFTICRNTYYRQRHRERRMVQCDDPALESLAAAAVHASAQQSGLGDLFAQVDLVDAIERALGELPDVFREAVILVDVQDQSYDAAALVAGVPVGTIRSRLYRGRRLLQERLLTHARDAGLARPGNPSPKEELHR